MLGLTRCAGEDIGIRDNVRLTVVAIRGNKARIQITTPAGVQVCRSEILGRAGAPKLPDTASHFAQQDAHTQESQRTSSNR